MEKWFQNTYVNFLYETYISKKKYWIFKYYRHLRSDFIRYKKYIYRLQKGDTSRKLGRWNIEKSVNICENHSVWSPEPGKLSISRVKIWTLWETLATESKLSKLSTISQSNARIANSLGPTSTRFSLKAEYPSWQQTLSLNLIPECQPPEEIRHSRTGWKLRQKSSTLRKATSKR